jgi:roadblock/LC7 domain-containing protein
MVNCALESSNGKLLIYASSFASSEERFRPVSAAAQKMAKLLKLNFEVVIFGEKITPIYVYYKNGDEESIPVYCNKGEKADVQEIYTTLRNMMFVLSFHPRHSALRHVRKEFMRLFS